MSTLNDGGNTAMSRKRVPVFHNAPPRLDNQADVPVDAARAEFGRRLQHMLKERNWNQSDLARAATKHMPGKKQFRRDNISNYVRGQQVPGPVRMKALCEALGVSRDDLLPPFAVRSVDSLVPPLDMRSQPDGRVYLRVNQVVDQVIAMQIITLLMPKKDGA